MRVALIIGCAATCEQCYKRDLDRNAAQGIMIAHELTAVRQVIVLALLAGVMAATRITAQQRETVLIAGRQVSVWHPDASSSAPQPVLVFSHGYGGCATQSSFLMAGLASRGYWVFAPRHADARCGGRNPGARPEEPFNAPQSWSDATYRDRAEDIRAIVQGIGTGSEYAGRVDLTRLGLIGHSLGGYTVLGLAGAWPSWKLPGVKAVLALSPYAQPYLVHGTLSGLSAPVMYQGGTLDIGITPWIRKTGGGYDASPAPKYFAEFAGAGHLAWTDIRDTAHQQIVEYSVAFLDHYLRGSRAPPLLTRAEAGVAEVRYQSELGAGHSPAARSGRRPAPLPY